jgi:cyclomaltodextrinase / maltogenic alpha-amylase / neopullulanase
MSQQEKPSPFSEQATALKKGIYEHYKGNRYEVLGVGRHSETLEEQVVYKGLYGDNDLWIRPLNMFLEDIITSEGKKVPRFCYVQS